MASNEPFEAVVAAQHAIGTRFAGYRFNENMSSPMPDEQELAWNESGLWVYRNANCEDRHARPAFGGWAGVSAGKADAWLSHAAHMIHRHFSRERPYLYSPHHEQAVANAQQCGIGCNGTPAEYQAFFRYVVQFFRNEGVADRMRFCCVPVVGQYVNDNPTDGISAVDPGPEWVDIYGCDSYTRGTPLSRATPQSAGIDLVGAYAADRGKLAMLGEFGVQANTAEAAAYLGAALELFRSQGNWFAVFTDVASMGSELLPVWHDAARNAAFSFASPTPSFATDGDHVTEDGSRIGPRARSEAEAQMIAAWLSGGGYDAIGV